MLCLVLSYKRFDSFWIYFFFDPIRDPIRGLIRVLIRDPARDPVRSGPVRSWFCRRRIKNKQ